MGSWGAGAWENDKAADWFGDLFDAVPLRQHVRAALEKAETIEEVRAASLVVILLGRAYMWPVDHLDEDLGAAIARLEELRDSNTTAEERELIKVEIDIMKARAAGEEATAARADTHLEVWRRLS